MGDEDRVCLTNVSFGTEVTEAPRCMSVVLGGFASGRSFGCRSVSGGNLLGESDAIRSSTSGISTSSIMETGWSVIATTSGSRIGSTSMLVSAKLLKDVTPGEARLHAFNLEDCAADGLGDGSFKILPIVAHGSGSDRKLNGAHVDALS